MTLLGLVLMLPHVYFQLLKVHSHVNVSVSANVQVA